ncbi:NAD-dependent epimerase/dehydratase family protein [Desulfoplanes formicivorans]|uniref:Epimerase n=1 Tax=Desulfoplanes formicivorans TaxID=1592317 RepID=A0A194AGB8_9BACT|nr:NAD(P)-dependent oxidoreductase [Desulfoplanes formicivorans]GAU09122.1 epimerase [Desulfoplanes formicivorans]
MKRIVVTGGSGFIGTHFIALYRSAYDEMANIDFKPPMLNEQADLWHDIDLLDYEKLESFLLAFQPTHILHLAARTDLDEKKSIAGYAANIDGVRNLLKAGKKVQALERVVIASSMLVCKVGHIPQSSHEYSPGNLYAKSKVETELITRHASMPCTWTIVRPTTIWGPYHHGLKNGFFTILQKKIYFHPGKNECLKSYGYVKNTAYQIQEIFNSAKEKVHKKTIYLADEPIKLHEWVNAFSERLIGKKAYSLPYPLMKCAAVCGDIAEVIIGKKMPMNTFRLKNMTTDNVVNTSHIKNLCPSLPYSQEDGVEETCLWLQNCNREM